MPVTNRPAIPIACSTALATTDVGPTCSARMTVTIEWMPKAMTCPGSTRVIQSKTSNGTKGRPASFQAA